MKHCLLYLIILFPFVACSTPESEKVESGSEAKNSDLVSSSRRKELIEKLKGTTWRQISNVTLYKPSGEENRVAVVSEPITFSATKFSNELGSFPEYRYRLYVGTDFIGYWTVTDKYELFTRAEMLSDEGIGWYISKIGFSNNVDFVGNTMICTKSSDYGDFSSFNTKKYTRIDSNSGTDTNNNGSSYEVPEVGFYDYTSTKTSLNVQYKIYNADAAKVQSAKIYYGKNSATTSVTATVSGVLITARITGLTAGTTYYVKCSATGLGGTTATSETRCITSY